MAEKLEGTWKSRNREKYLAAERKRAKSRRDKDPDKDRARVRKWKSLNPEKCRESTKKWQRENRDAKWLYKLRYEARKKGIPFDEETSDIVIPDQCPILGIEIFRDLGGTGFKPHSPSLDKVVPALGYVKGNRHVVSNRANLLKRDATLDELILLGKWAESQKELRCQTS